MKNTALRRDARQVANGKIAVKLNNEIGSPVAFFNRIALLNRATGKRVLPAFYSDNYVSILPGETKTVYIEYDNTLIATQDKLVEVYGWNVLDQKVDIKILKD